MSSTQRVKFHFHPFNPENNEHVVEKAQGGMKRRYLRGVASGVAVDGHGERMTERCIKSFSEQANSGDILLYPDLHGVKFTDDIGLLVGHEVLPNNDWFIESRLYDEGDGVGANTLERADKLWKQINGLPPYKSPKQKGFSIEGILGENGIIQASNDGRRVMDNVILDGIVVVPRPAYKDSIAHAVYKALGEQPPWITEKLLSDVFSFVGKSEDMTYQYGRYQVEDALYKAIDNIMGSDFVNKHERLDEVFNQYKEHMINLINKSEFDTISNKDLLIDNNKMVAKATTSGKSIDRRVFKELINTIIEVEASIRKSQTKR